jgi:selenocysteine-specific elongation factor
VRSFVVGTAGHIDHGKSALVLALTGTDPDRLKEEKERGITIDLGFAHAPLGEGLVASFVDVPGHERFVRNMLAGAHGIDAVLLVIAADESVMPQTREHFEICRLLGIAHGVVVLTKCDLADPEMQTVAEMEARELVKGSFLESAPLVRVSARTGEGLSELRAALVVLAAETGERRADGLLRLPIDRAFTLHGFGTVVTGTVVSGRLEAGMEIEVLPARRRARVRGLQVHGGAAASIPAGSRAAVNLAGIEVDELSRGDVLTVPGTLATTSMLDVEITLIESARPLLDQARVRVHVASAEVLARVRALGPAPVPPGGSTLAQLRLETPAVAGRGDRLVLRAYSPAVTIGGALVLDPQPPKRRGASGSARVAALRGADLADAAVAMVVESGASGLAAGVLQARLAVPPPLVAELAKDGRLQRFGVEPGTFVARETLNALAGSVREAVETFHSEQPLKSAMPREEIRTRLFARSPEGVLEHVLRSLAEAGTLRVEADALALGSHTVRLSPKESQARDAILEAARAAGLAGVEREVLPSSLRDDPRLLDRISRLLLEQGDLRRVGDGLVHREPLDALKTTVRERWPPGSRLDVAALKELTGLSRKYVIPLLEYLDRERVTRRSGADRVVLSL